jgi:hypothetical protein
MKKNYKASDDIWAWKHHNMTHRSVSEAFKDADYATAIYKPKSEWDDCIEFMGGIVFMMPVLAFFVYVCYLILKGV